MSIKTFEYFLKIPLPVMLVSTGLLANCLVIIVYSREKFNRLPTKNILRLIALADTFCLVQQTKFSLRYIFNIDIYTISSFMCKFFVYISHFNFISAWLLVYISTDRMLSILFPNITKRLKPFQSIICFIICAINCIFFGQRLIYQELTISNVTNTTLCHIADKYQAYFKVFEWIDLMISILVPFVLMLLCSVFLIISIFQSRRRFRAKSSFAKRKLNRDLKFSITLVFLDISFVSLNLPITVFFLVNIWTHESLTWFYLLDDLYYASYSVNFFIYLLVNVEFRNEFLVMIHLNKLIKRSQDYFK